MARAPKSVLEKGMDGSGEIVERDPHGVPPSHAHARSARHRCVVSLVLLVRLTSEMVSDLGAQLGGELTVSAGIALSPLCRFQDGGGWP